MATYLLTWNPKRFVWNSLEEDIEELAAYGGLSGRWSCGRTRRCKPGDRFYLLRLGDRVADKGIVGSGDIVSAPFEDEHWSDDKLQEGATTLYVDVIFDALLDADSGDVLPMELLEADPVLSQMHWHSQTSGISIPEPVSTELGKRWSQLLDSAREPTSDEIEMPSPFLEGRAREVRLTVYERNPVARARCLQYYGCYCHICHFDFEQAYGLVGRGFIHVHHIVPVSEIGAEYVVDAIRDLRPVCPNCHAVIHRRRPPYSIEEVKAFLVAKR